MTKKLTATPKQRRWGNTHPNGGAHFPNEVRRRKTPPPKWRRKENTATPKKDHFIFICLILLHCKPGSIRLHHDVAFQKKRSNTTTTPLPKNGKHSNTNNGRLNTSSSSIKFNYVFLFNYNHTSDGTSLKTHPQEFRLKFFLNIFGSPSNLKMFEVQEFFCIFSEELRFKHLNIFDGATL